MSTDEPCNTGDEIGGRRTEWLLHRPSLKPVAGQIAVLRIPRTPPPPFAALADAQRQGLI